jgi:hypothetical protein
MVPLCVVVALGAAEVLAAGIAHSAAAGAAQAAAMALVQGGDPQEAAHAATPGWTHSRVTVSVSGRHVHIHITPPGLLPGTASLLATDAEADAGPVA